MLLWSKNFKLIDDKGEIINDPSSYMRLVRRLIYLVNIRPDITYAVNMSSQFMLVPIKSHWDSALQTVRYLKKISGLGLLFSVNSSLKVRDYHDAIWANCPITWRSKSQYIVFLDDSVTSWKAKKKKTISMLFAEPKYRSIG